MHRTVALLLALMFLPLPALAQDAAPVRLLDEGSGDVHGVGAPGEPAFPARFATLDLIGLDAIDGPDTLRFELEVVNLDATTEISVLESAIFHVHFMHLDKVYRVLLGRWTEAASSGTWGFLQELNSAGDGWDWVASVDVSQDQERNRLIADVPRTEIHDRNGAAPFPGRTLTDVWVQSRQILLNPDDMESLAGEAVGIADRMPDTGVGTVAFPFQFGPPQDGVGLSSPRPFRVSNGDATTFVYDVRVTNPSDPADRIALRAEGAPSAWHIGFPVESVTLAPGEFQDLHVLATVPFAHQHGAREAFTLVAEAGDGGRAELELGLLYTDVPQPSGHHSRLWFHSVPYGTNLITQATAPAPGRDTALVFNAQQDYEPADGASVQASWNIGGVSNGRNWFAYLSPSLGMGLDFDLGGQATVSLPIETVAPMTAAKLYVDLWHWGTNDRENYDTTKVFAGTVSAGDWGPQEVRTVELALDILPDADKLGLYDRQGLSMNIRLLNGPDGSASDVYIAPGGFMDLPLHEFHDDLQAIDAVSTLVLDPLAETERSVRPGAAAAFPFDVANHDADTHVELTVVGEATEWVTIDGAHANLGRHESKQATVVVAVPSAAKDGDLVDFVLEATSDDGRTALHRIRVLVDSDAPVEVVSADAEAKNTPSAPAGLLLLGLLALARRRD